MWGVRNIMFVYNSLQFGDGVLFKELLEIPDMAGYLDKANDPSKLSIFPTKNRVFCFVNWV